MKKFLTTILVIIVAVSLGFGVFFLVKDNEVISLKSASLYKNAGDKFEFGVDIADANSSTTVECYSTNESVIKVEKQKLEIKDKAAKGQFEAVSGGSAKIVFKTNNAKFRNITCDVIVCDGITVPFRITTAQDLKNIGAKDSPYTLASSYELVNDIDLGTVIDIANGETWTPIENFKGSLNGNGHTIENLYVSGAFTNIGLFGKIENTAVVKNVKFNNAVIKVSGNASATAGVVAGINSGTVERIEVISANIINGENDNAYIGGVVGYLLSTNTESSQKVAKVDRASVNAQFTNGVDGETTKSIKGTVGGVVGYSQGGKVVFSYSKGTMDCGSATLAGGIVAKANSLAKQNASGNEIGAHIQETYTILKFTSSNANTGYIIGENGSNKNTISGNYYVANEGKSIKGIAKSTGEDNDYMAVASNEDDLSKNSLKALDTLVSSSVVKGTYEWDNASMTYKFTPTLVDGQKQYIINSWNTDVWQTAVGQNDGYPILSYVDRIVSPATTDQTITNASKISSVEEFKKINDDLNGTYIVYNDVNKIIDFSTAGNWEPIGTSTKKFNGKIYFTQGMIIKNLTVENKANAGLFGWVGENAVINGITIENANISGTNAGAVAGVNEGTISNFTIKNSTIKTDGFGGGVVGINAVHGDIRAYNNEDNTVTVTLMGMVEKTNILSATSSTAIGGVVGQNNGRVAGASSEKTVIVNEVKVSADDNVSVGSSALFGGLVGDNNGVVAFVNINKTNVDASKAISTVHVGGIAGETSGSIVGFVVNESKVVAPATGYMYVGGVAGGIYFEKAPETDAKAYDNSYTIKGGSVLNCEITGANAGGIAAGLNTGYKVVIPAEKTSIDLFKCFVAMVTDTIGVDTSSLVANVSVVEVKGTKLYGETTAGFIVTLSSGVVANVYNDAELNGDYNAGMVYTISFKAADKTGGIMFNAASEANATKGTSYAVSVNDIHKEATLEKRNCGFIVNYHYLKSSTLKNPSYAAGLRQVGDWFAELGYGVANWFAGGKLEYDRYETGLDSSEFKKASKWSFLNGNVWTVNDGQTPSLKINISALQTEGSETANA